MLVLVGDHLISYRVVRAVSEKLGGPVDIFHLDKYPDVYDCFEGNIYSHASSFVSRRLLQVSVLLHLRFSSKIPIILINGISVMLHG